MNPTHKVLIVDDEATLRELLSVTLTQMGVCPIEAESLSAARKKLQQEQFSLCLLDMRLQDGTALEFLPFLQKTYPNMPVAIITAYGSMQNAIAALKKGAFDYINKPIDLPILKNLIKTALQASVLQTKYNRTINQKALDQLLGHSTIIAYIQELILKFSVTQAPVHIFGPSGCGKELVARIIHESGPRFQGPFIAINCGAIPSELMESEFFGHKKGSFTNAHQDKIGLFQAAHKGTLFLDEISELPINMQVKLLRAIQEKNVRPIGQNAEIKVDVRILSASNKPLTTLIEQGAFREDLYYRIHVLCIEIPPLSKRKEDIPILSEAILEKIAQANKKSPFHLSEEALKVLCDYEFPGNVRELENILERACALCQKNTILACDLGLENKDTKQANPQKLPSQLALIEKEMLLKALAENNHNQTLAAKQLGITPRTLRYRLKKLNIRK